MKEITSNNVTHQLSQETLSDIVGGSGASNCTKSTHPTSATAAETASDFDTSLSASYDYPILGRLNSDSVESGLKRDPNFRPDNIYDHDMREVRCSNVSLSDIVASCPAVNYPKGTDSTFYQSLNDLPAQVNIYFGVGLGSPKGLSKGLPIDLLNMVFLAEGVGAEKHIIVADQA